MNAVGRAWWQLAADRILGTQRRSRFALRLWFVALSVYLVGAGVLAVLSQLDVVRPDVALALSMFMAAGVIVFYVLLRTSIVRLLSDRTLFVAQCIHALMCASAAYAITGPTRASALMIVILILVFTMFSMNTAVQRWVAACAVAMLGATMAVMSEIEPARYPPLYEAIHFMSLLTVTLAITVLATQLTSLRERVRDQKAELEIALQRIQALATRDELTGLMNRRHMQDVMMHEHQRCMRSGQPFCIAVLDLDNFKMVNDRYGHPAGDAVLRAFARDATAAIRIADVLARWGGEEFLLLMTDTRASLARQGVERVRDRISSLRVRVDSGTLLELTVSVGVTEHRPGEPLAETIARADRALYAAKAEGRDRVVMHE